MTFVDITIGDVGFRARLLEERSPEAVAAVWQALPFAGRVGHGMWSGDLFRMLDPAPLATVPRDRGAAFQHPGLVVLEPTVREIAVCYGQGRLNLATTPLHPIPLAEIGGDLAPLARLGRDLQWEGAKPISFQRAADQDSPLASPPAPVGRTIEVALDGVAWRATLLEAVSPATTAAFARLLPLAGMATNTVSSGPLTRFWNPDGGPEGETPLDAGEHDPSQVILYPGYVYYLPSPPWRGLRIAREATMMRGPAGGGGPRLVPLARFDGDWSGFAAQAARLLVDGAKPLSFRLVAD